MAEPGATTGAGSPTRCGRNASSSRVAPIASSIPSVVSWATPLASCTRGPPSCSMVTSSPSAARTTLGPVRNIRPSSAMTTKSVSAGE